MAQNLSRGLIGPTLQSEKINTYLGIRKSREFLIFRPHLWLDEYTYSYPTIRCSTAYSVVRFLICIYIFLIFLFQFPVYINLCEEEEDCAQEIVSEKANVFLKYIKRQSELKGENLRNKRKTEPEKSVKASKVPKLQ